MPTNPKEVERLKRIRDQQLRARDPLIKQRKLDHTIASKHRQARGRFSFGKMWSEIPHRWRDATLGALLGSAAMIIVPGLIPGNWGLCLGVGALPFAAFLGFLIGRYEDSKEDVKDLIP